ncbi:MAG: hypothetical protein FWC02_01375 [Firmicutes bacterium]|nr:hypothetical protein [Bacillota bacterium]
MRKRIKIATIKERHNGNLGIDLGENIINMLKIKRGQTVVISADRRDEYQIKIKLSGRLNDEYNFN